jgi:signal recognition particle subunit SRP72
MIQEIITTTATKKKRKRKPKLPANYDPEMPPDPERWLPRQERTAYRKKLHKKFKDREVGRGTQGTAAASATSPNMFETILNYNFISPIFLQ